MSRTVVVTAAALMLAGLTSVSLADDKEHNSTPKETSAVSSDVVTAESSNEKTTKVAVSSSPQLAETIADAYEEAALTGKSEQHTEPMAENKPATTLSDAAKSTVKTVNKQAKEAVTDSVKSVKSAVPTPTMPTSPTVEATKTIVTPVAPQTALTK